MANVGVGIQDPAHVHDGEPVNQGRRRFLTATTAVVGAVGVGVAAVPFIKSWNPSARA
ncbi:MAG TPA: ubiquinol-cytochrome c reductase iron-sulfur subunit N-terminal domain-containing protein, partial [Lysobacter sp.]|nr:ubiquinol-cytochrome c reductase iron-sulfur subunit N-terminal domain-containing protein [Lysobacter sp.]